jgi:hypothetical protein
MYYFLNFEPSELSFTLAWQAEASRIKTAPIGSMKNYKWM